MFIIITNNEHAKSRASAVIVLNNNHESLKGRKGKRIAEEKRDDICFDTGDGVERARAISSLFSASNSPLTAASDHTDNNTHYATADLSSFLSVFRVRAGRMEYLKQGQLPHESQTWQILVISLTPCGAWPLGDSWLVILPASATRYWPDYSRLLPVGSRKWKMSARSRLTN